MKKLVLKKEVISTLAGNEMKQVRGGANTGFDASCPCLFRDSTDHETCGACPAIDDDSFMTCEQCNIPPTEWAASCKLTGC